MFIHVVLALCCVNCLCSMTRQDGACEVRVAAGSVWQCAIQTNTQCGRRTITGRPTSLASLRRAPFGPERSRDLRPFGSRTTPSGAGPGSREPSQSFRLPMEARSLPRSLPRIWRRPARLRRPMSRISSGRLWTPSCTTLCESVRRAARRVASPRRIATGATQSCRKRPCALTTSLCRSFTASPRCAACDHARARRAPA